MIKKKRLKIAYPMTDDFRGQSSFNVGTRIYIAKYLEKHLGDVDFIGPLSNMSNSLKYRTKRRIYKYFFRKKYLPNRSPQVLYHFAKQIKDRIKNRHYDLIFTPDNIEISHLEIDIPIVFYTDAIFDSMIDFYKEYSNLCKESIEDGHNQEQAALDRAMLAIFSSQWAADAAIRNFNVDPNKVKVVPFGANISRIPDSKNIFEQKNNRVCTLFFIGADWERKGGSIAVETVDKLNRMQLKSTLFVCSRISPDESLNDFTQNIGLLDRSKESENKRLENLFLTSHFLILPTKADCSPGVFREAAAFGLPVITTDVGGNSSVIENGVNGIMLSHKAGPEEYANVILEYYKDDKKYQSLCKGSRDMFDRVLNWDKSILTVADLINGMLKA